MRLNAVAINPRGAILHRAKKTLGGPAVRRFGAAEVCERRRAFGCFLDFHEK
jgi:hypothetical protein